MKIQYRSNLIAGCMAVLMALALFFLIPSQIAMESQSIHGITSRTLPYGLCMLVGGAGLALIIQSLILKKDTVKVLEVEKEAKGLLYMGCLLAYGIGFSYSFVISTCLLGIVTLAFTKCRKISYYFIVVAVVVVLYVVFTRLLHVRLP